MRTGESVAPRRERDGREPVTGTSRVAPRHDQDPICIAPRDEAALPRSAASRTADTLAGLLDEDLDVLKGRVSIRSNRTNETKKQIQTKKKRHEPSSSGSLKQLWISFYALYYLPNRCVLILTPR